MFEMLSAPVVALTVATRSSTHTLPIYGIQRRSRICQPPGAIRRHVVHRKIDADQLGVDALHRIGIRLHHRADIAAVRMGHALHAPVLGIDRRQAAMVYPDAVEQRRHLRAKRVGREAGHRIAGIVVAVLGDAVGAGHRQNLVHELARDPGRVRGVARRPEIRADHGADRACAADALQHQRQVRGDQRRPHVAAVAHGEIDRTVYPPARMASPIATPVPYGSESVWAAVFTHCTWRDQIDGISTWVGAAWAEASVGNATSLTRPCCRGGRGARQEITSVHSNYPPLVRVDGKTVSLSSEILRSRLQASGL